MNQPMLPNHIQTLLAGSGEGQKVVLVTGVFDLLHDEHRLFLQKAKAAGDILIVALESDVRVRQLKGAGRPVWDEEKRRQEIAALAFVDGVFVLPEEFSRPDHHEQLISEVRPAILAVSSHSPHLHKKQLILEKYHGKVVVVHQHNPNISTTLTLNQSLTSR